MENNGKTTLPPLPSSDEKALAWNTRDNFYDVRSRDWWGENQITHEKVDEYKNCEHYFIFKAPGVECKKCHMGLIGYFEIQNGKLFYKGEPLGI